MLKAYNRRSRHKEMADINAIAEQIQGLTLLEASQLVKLLEVKLEARGRGPGAGVYDRDSVAITALMDPTPYACCEEYALVAGPWPPAPDFYFWQFDEGRNSC